MSAIGRRIQLLALAAAFALACASTPESVVRARENLRAAEADPAVVNGASIELDQARKAVARLEDAAEDDDVGEEELDHLAYIVDQKIQIARIAATEAETRRQVEELSEKRDALRLRVRSSKSERARVPAEATPTDAPEAGRAQPDQVEVEVKTVK
jgi:Domain of unknown function (DUF4398)